MIEITDDGRGLDRAKIIEKAKSKGLIETAEGLSDNEIYNLIFQPGFSTAAQVTNVSGRGVGMDVVRRHIEKLRGRIEIRSAVGEGATFLLKLPLTLAIIDGLVVGVGEERYIVPLFAVREMFRPTADTIWTVKQKAEMALVRGGLLPVIRLYRLFRVKPKTEDPLNAVLVVAEVEGQRFCVLVDELIGKQEVVIKSLGETVQERDRGGRRRHSGRRTGGVDSGSGPHLQGERSVTWSLPAPEADTVRPLAREEFEQFRQLAYRTFGLDLKAGKEELVSARLRKLVRRGGSIAFRTITGAS